MGSEMCIRDRASAQFATSGPFLPTERNFSLMSRDVPATTYRDPYCTKWTDSCSVCQRKTANDEAVCEAAEGSDTTCQRKPVRCEAASLKTLDRLCIYHTDGCNQCTNRSCGLRPCEDKPKDFVCELTRKTAYELPEQLKLDLAGHWRLTDPQGRSCEVMLDEGVTLTAACAALGEPVTQLREFDTTASSLQMLRTDGSAGLSFDASNPDALTGIESAQGYRMTRLDPEPFVTRWWEGAWQLKADDGPSCQLFLSQRARPIAGENSIIVVEPHGIAYAALCFSVGDEAALRLRSISRIDPGPGASDIMRRMGVTRDVRLAIPVWTGWSIHTHSITFRDTAGKTTTFKRGDDMNWTSELPQPDGPPVVLQLKPLFL